MSPTERSLVECRKRGWAAGVVERRLPHVHITVDYLGFADILALDAEPGVMAIQATTAGHSSDRLAKIAANELAARWIVHGNRIEVWGWAKRGPRGQRKLWTLDVCRITLDTFDESISLDHTKAGSKS